MADGFGDPERRFETVIGLRLAVDLGRNALHAALLEQSEWLKVGKITLDPAYTELCNQVADAVFPGETFPVEVVDDISLKLGDTVEPFDNNTYRIIQCFSILAAHRGTPLGKEALAAYGLYDGFKDLYVGRVYPHYLKKFKTLGNTEDQPLVIIGGEPGQEIMRLNPRAILLDKREEIAKNIADAAASEAADPHYDFCEASDDIGAYTRQLEAFLSLDASEKPPIPIFIQEPRKPQAFKSARQRVINGLPDHVRKHPVIVQRLQALNTHGTQIMPREETGVREHPAVPFRGI